MQLYADGWYVSKDDAQNGLDLCVKMGALPIGLVESAEASWAYIYWSNKELFKNHRIDGKNCLNAVRRAVER